MTYFFLALIVISVITLCVLSLKGESVGFVESKPDYFSLSGCIDPNHRTRLPVSLCMKTVEKSLSLLKSRDKLFEYENWLYGNGYKVLQRLKSLKSFKVYRLPAYKAMPRLYFILAQCINECDGKLDKWAEYVEKFNNYGYLLYREIVALKDVAAYALCEYLTVFYSKSTVSYTCFLKGKKDGAQRKIDVGRIKYASYLSGLLQSADNAFEKRIKLLCESNGIDLYGKIAEYRSERDVYCVKVKNAIVSLVNLHLTVSEDAMLRASKVSEKLDNSGVFYKENDNATKLECLRIIAKQSKHGREVATAIKYIEKAKKSGNDVYTELAKKPYSVPFYVLLFLLKLIPSVVACAVVWNVFSPLFAVPFFAVVYTFIKHVCGFLAQSSLSFTPRVRKTDKQTLIVISALVLNGADAEHAVNRAKTVKRANPDFDVCLLVDFANSKTKENNGDSELISKLSNLTDGVFLVVRERKECGGEYVAWEKKRGAITELFRYILSGAADFAYCTLAKTDYTYAITLDIDSDIILAERAVKAISHPYFSNESVLSFFSIPSLLCRNTPYAKLFNDKACGYAVSGFTAENDLFGRGNYTGKGICKIKEFYERTVDVFPDNRILSHDFIEGAFSRCRNCDVTVSESVPQTYGQNIARESRWIRGDWQLLPYLLSVVTDRNANKRKNAIGLVNKAHIVANMFSSLYPVFLLVCLLFSRGYFVLFALAVPLFSVVASLTEVFTAPKKIAVNLTRQLYLLATLPTSAIIALYSVIITIIRLARRKNLLQWKTFRHASFKNYSAIFSLVFGVGFIALSMLLVDVGLLVVGIIFLSGTLTFLLDLQPQKKPVSAEFRKTALDIMNATASFFTNSLAQSPLYLIPDFYSEESGRYSAMTSPTNIGFSLVALKCMCKTGFIKEQEYKEKSDKILRTVSTLKKHCGHLYNWYDVKSGEPLPPRYVSTVDSGNFCMALCFVMDSLSSEGRDIAQNIINGIDFSFLVNADRKLLATGFNNDTKKLDESCYDLYASESLLSYIFCLGYNKIDGKCAFSLDTSRVRYCGNTLYSWTGGAFEYLMTSLFVPYVKGSELYESALSHVRAQQRFSLPFWGISESQYNAYDDSGNRKYKAFGVDKTAYKTAYGTARAPYASVLCVEFAPTNVIKNLNNAQSWGMRGTYGLYEAYDGEVIKTYMAHHQGMIMLALYNALTNNADKAVLSASPEINSALLYLLLPKSDEFAQVKKEYKIPAKTIITPKSENVFSKNVMLSGTYAVAYSDRGESEAFYAGKCMYSNGNDIILTVMGKSYSLLSGAKSAFDEGRCTYLTDNQHFRAVVTISGASIFDGEIRDVEITNKTSKPQNCTIGFYTEPVLVRKEEYTAHKTYSKMFLKTAEAEDMLMAYKDGVTLAVALENCDIKECDRGRIFRKSRSQINVDCCLFLSKTFTLQSEQSTHIYSSLICAKSELLAQNLAYVFLKSDKNTLMETSVRQTASASIGEKIKNTIPALETAKIPGIYGINTPIIMLDCTENRLYKLKQVCSAIIKASYFASRFTVLITYTERDGYFRSEGSRARSEMERAQRESGYGNVSFELLEKNADKDKIQALTPFAVRPENTFTLYPRKSLLVKKSEEYAKLVLPEITHSTDCGGFYKDGFLIEKAPPKTWSNIVSNGNIGFITTESGDGYTFYSSSRQEKVTDFSFDPIKANLSEGVVFYEDGLVWSASPSPMGERCYCMHESGKTVYKTGYNGLSITQKIGIGGSNKFVVINLLNATNKVRKIYVTFFACTVLGDFSENTKNSITYARNSNVLTAKNSQNGLSVSLSCNKDMIAYSFDTQSMLAKSGEVVKIKDFAKSEKRNGFVYTVCISVEKEQQVVFSLGKNSSPDFARAENIIEEYCEQSKKMSAVEIKTNDADTDCVFPWLIPQVYFSRFKARCGFYQVGGAYGFRDQLQDCLALLYVDACEVREHILYCAQRQFESGDVMHWWHHPYVGVRTRISDDRLFLPYVTAKYIAFTGDKSILDEQIPFLKDEKFDKVLYKQFTPTQYKTSLKDHIIRAIHSCKFSKNGLVLIGDGDWNDAMDKAGSKGAGSSVWLSMFLYAVINECKDFLDNSDFYGRILSRLKESVNNMFDGNSFARLVTDEGIKLGYNDGFIDIITQAWATLSGIADEKTCSTALQSAEKLVDENKRIIRLLYPPFEKNSPIGSIGKYPAGVRENGGQYTHGAVWYVMALYKTGETEKAYKYLRYLLPSTHSKNGGSALYKNEPYVISADVYGSGEGGWSWYTGSASWMYVLIVEYLFGIKKTADVITITPALPKSVEKAELSLRFSDMCFKISIDNTGEGEWRIFYNKLMHENNSLMINPKNSGKRFTLKKVNRTR